MSSLALIFEILAVDEASEKFRHIAKSAEDTHGGLQKLATFGKAALLGLGTSLVAVGGFSLKMADEFEVSHAKLEAALKGSGHSLEEFKKPLEVADRQMAKFGFTNADVEAALAQFTVSLKDPREGLKQMGLAADLAKFKNIPLADSALIVAKAMEGQLKPLKALGIDLPVAAGGALRLQKAHDGLAAAQKKVADLLVAFPDAANKASKGHKQYEVAVDGVKTAEGKLAAQQNVAATILKALHERMGGQAATAAQTFAGKIAALKAEIENVGTKIGLALIPILEKLMGAIQDAIGWFGKHKVVAEALAVTVGTVLVTAIGTYVASLITAGVTSVRTYATMIASAATWTASTVASFGTTIAIQAMYAREAVVAGAKVMLTYVKMAASAVAGAVAQVGAWISVAAAATAAFIAENIATLGIIAGIALLIAAGVYLYKHWDEIWSSIKRIVASAAGWVRDQMIAIVERFAPVRSALSMLAGAWSAIWGGIQSVTQTVGGIIRGIIDGITSALSSVTSAVSSVVSTVNSAKSSVGGGIGAWLNNPLSFGGGKASGGYVSSGMSYLVGENGPEMFRPDGRGGGTVTPNSQLGDMAGVESRLDALMAVVSGLPRAHQQMVRAT